MKKIRKTSGILFLALLLACTAGVLENDAKTVSAETVKVRKLKMKKKKISVTVGKKVKLGVSVKPKKAKVKWSSNTKKIATVSKKGVVKGIHKGTAKITAKSGKKSAVCKVSVKAKKKKTATPAGVKAVTVLNSKGIRVTLTKAASLNAANFSVKKKYNGKGAYNTALKIGSVVKVSSTVYDVILDTDITVYDTYEVNDTNRLNSGDYVQVIISKLGGAKSGETIYYASRYARNTYRKLMVGESYEEGLGFSQSGVGYVSGIKVSGVPDGLTAKVYGETVYVSGTPTVAKASVMTFTGKDEMGRNLTQKVYFYIGSESVMFCYTELENNSILINDSMSEWFEIQVVGGSGDYNYSLLGNTNKMIRLSGKSIIFDSHTADDGKRAYLNPGAYRVAYTVEDDQGHSCNGNLSVNGVKGVTVSGKVMAEDNSGVEDATVYANLEDEKHVYYLDTVNAYTSSEGMYDSTAGVKRKVGEYSLVLYPSQLYNFRAQKANVPNYANVRRTGTSNMTLNFKLPLYKVNLACGSDDLSDVKWVNAVGMTQGYGETLYCKKGRYKLTGTSKLYNYTADFTVNGECVVTAKRTTVITADAVLTEGEQTTVFVGGESKIIAFTPLVSDSYRIVFNASIKVIARVYDADTGKQINWSDNSHYVEDADGNSSWEYGVLEMTENLTAGKTYYLHLSVPEGIGIAEVSVNVSKTPRI